MTSPQIRSEPVSVENLPRRRTAPKTMRSHEEIYDLVAMCGVKSEEAAKEARDAVHRTDMLTEVVQRVEIKLDALAKAIGAEREDESGQRVGTGVVGRLMRLESTVAKRFGQYDGWVKLVVGFTAAAVLFIPALWWLIDGKLEGLLK